MTLGLGCKPGEVWIGNPNCGIVLLHIRLAKFVCVCVSYPWPVATVFKFQEFWLVYGGNLGFAGDARFTSLYLRVS